MKYYSENLNKLFDTPEALREAETAASTREQTRAARTQELDAAREALVKANENYMRLLRAYCKDYDQYTYSGAPSADPSVITSLLRSLRIS